MDLELIAPAALLTLPAIPLENLPAQFFVVRCRQAKPPAVGNFFAHAERLSSWTNFCCCGAGRKWRDLTYPGSLDYVLHFASPASPPDYLQFPIETLQVGSFGTFNALQLAEQKKSKFLMASTSECYGDPEVSPQPESCWGRVNPVGPRSVYDEAKRFSEALTMAFHRARGLDTRIVRIFNTYGPRMRLNDGRALPNFLYQALTGKPRLTSARTYSNRELPKRWLELDSVPVTSLSMQTTSQS